MTLDELKTLIHAVHKPELIKERSHVFEMWEDGEITLTKAGDLYHQRTIHQMLPPLISTEMAEKVKPLMPLQHGKHASVVLEEEDLESLQWAFKQL